jgi:nucleoside phosphorylase
MILSAGNEEIFSFARPIGIGLIESAINLTHICLLDRPQSLIFIGSAGSYNPNKHKIFDIVTSSSASQIEISFLKKESYTPIEQIITANVSHETIVNSSNYITTDKLSALAFDKLGMEIENMEFYSVMKVAKEFNIPVIGIFVITNYCDKDAHQQYLKNIKQAKQILIDYLKNKGYIK